MNQITLAVAVVLWAVVAVRAGTVTAGGAQRYLWLALVALAAAVTLDVPSVAAAVERLTGVAPNLSQLLKHSLVMVAAATVYEAGRGLALTPPEAARGRRRRTLAAAGGLFLLAALFAVAPVHEQPLPGFTAAAPGEPALLAYTAVYVAALAAALLSIIRITWPAARTFPPGPLRAAMAWMSVGAGLGLAYCVHKAAYLSAATATAGAWPDAAGAELAQSALKAATFGALVVGMLWPTVAGRQVLRQVAAHRAHRRLRPLWQAYHDAEPAIALDTRGSRRLLRDAELRLYRRVIEIRDGMLAVRPYADPGSRQLSVHEAEKTGHSEPSIIGEAAWLEVARRAKLRGDSPNAKHVPAASGGADLASETRVLSHLAAASDTIRDLADRVESVTRTRTATS